MPYLSHIFTFILTSSSLFSGNCVAMYLFLYAILKKTFSKLLPFRYFVAFYIWCTLPLKILKRNIASDITC